MWRRAGFALAVSARRGSFVGLLGYMAALAEFYEVGWFVACPRVEHAEVYRRMFGFRELAEPRQYFGVNFETRLLGVRREELKAFVQAREAIHAAWTDAFEVLQETMGRRRYPIESEALKNPGGQVRQWSNTLGRCVCEEDFISQPAVL